MDLRGLLLSKNSRYGDSALTPIRIFSQADPVEQLRVRVDDKLSRIARGNLNLDDEDTIMDLAGYLILLMIARDVTNETNQTGGM
jgi:hypothetical protein